MSRAGPLRVAAVDLGASALRVAVVDLRAVPPVVRVVHRYPHAPVPDADGTLRWDWQRLVAEAERGLDLALREGPVCSIGVDTWGVDYGLLDRNGHLVAPPHSYRDRRTSGWRAVADRLGPERLYRLTGTQLMGINTVFQLAVHDRAELGRATTLLMLPELLVHALTGVVTAERTSAGTTGLIDVHSGTWSVPLLDEIDVERTLFPEVSPATAAVGRWRDVPVHLVGGHDTASAIAAVPGDGAFVSSGTWMLVGAQRPVVDVSDAARGANFSNEPGVLGGVRFLKNVMGLWLLQQCLHAWDDPPLAPLLEAAAALDASPLVDATDDRFLTPGNMPARVCRAAGLPDGTGRPLVVRCVLHSLAVATAAVVAELDGFLRGSEAREIDTIHLVGGGVRNGLLTRLVERASGRRVEAGAEEATALGNALVQGVAVGAYADLPEAQAAAAVARG